MRAVFNELRRLGFWKGENPLSKVRQFKISERELSYLTLEQIDALLKALEHNRDAWLTTAICLSTGARWSEAEGLRATQVKDGKVNFSETKSGKNRSIPIISQLEAELQQIKTMTGRLYKALLLGFSCAVKAAGLNLPQGQLTHVLRHTFASHFMMNGGNILVLQKLLGHSSLTMTMRYALCTPCAGSSDGGSYVKSFGAVDCWLTRLKSSKQNNLLTLCFYGARSRNRTGTPR